MRNCTNDFPTSDVLFDEIANDTLQIVILAVGCVLAVVTIFLHVEILIYMKRVGYNKYRHHYNQRCLLVGLYPVVCVMSVISLIVPASTTLVDLIMSCYISWCIYTFVQMTLDYYGREYEMVETLSGYKIHLSVPPVCCFCCCLLKPITLTKKSLRILKYLVMQVAFVRPILLFVAAVLWTDGRYEPKIEFDSSYPYIASLSGISTLLSMYGMIVIFRASRGQLRENCYIVKFVVLQLTVIIANLQSAIFNILAQYDIPGCNGSRGPRVRGAGINHALMVLESFLLCLLARWGYRRVEPHLARLAEYKHKTTCVKCSVTDSVNRTHVNTPSNEVHENNACTIDHP